MRSRRQAPDAAMDANQAAIALATAMSEARAALGGCEDAARDSSAAAVARLRALRVKLLPLYAAIPPEVELFDLGFVGPEKPRLFIDIIASVEPGQDSAGYRFVQDSRSGRATLLETEDEAILIEEITRYIARRLVLRERALAPQGAERPLRMLRQPSPVAPLIAEEALRQWAREGQARTPEPEAAANAPEADMPSAVTTSTDGSAEAAATPAPINRALTTQAHDAPTRRRLPLPQRPTRAARRGWVWPIAALGIGIALGALALYLYAAALPA